MTEDLKQKLEKCKETMKKYTPKYLDPRKLEITMTALLEEAKKELNNRGEA